MIRVNASLFLAVFSGSLAASGCKPDGAPPSDVDLAFDRMVRTPYAPDAPGCQPDIVPAGVPILRVADRAGFEYYFSSPDSIASWGFDYEVYPLAHATGTRVEFLHDSEVAAAPLVTSGECPTTIAGASLAVPAAQNDLVHARISLTSDLDADRFTDVYYLHGSRTITVQTGAAAAATDFGAPGSWFAGFVPLWGNPRVFFTHLPTPGTDVVISGVPNGPGFVVLLRTDLIEDGPAPGTLIAPGGFGEVWPYAVSQWFAIQLPAAFGNATVAPVNGIDLPQFWQRLEFQEAATWSVGRPNSLIPIGSGPTEASLPLPCNDSVSVMYIGIGTVTLNGGTSSPLEIAAGGFDTFNVTCAPGASAVMGTAAGLTGEPVRGLLLVIGGSQ